MSDITKMDLYELLEIEETCSTEQISSAFRKKALTCHPDKYPNDEEKKERFLLIKKALELLTDKDARSAYDACRKQKQVQKQRLEQMDEKRKKFKETLERNEQKASQSTVPTVNHNDDRKLRAEVERLRREGNRLVTEELEKLNQLLEEEKRRPTQQSNTLHIRIKYNRNKPLYTDDELRNIFQKYGRITEIVNANGKSALIELRAGSATSTIGNETGFDDRPFASVKCQQTSVSEPVSQSVKQKTDCIDLTGPSFEDFEKIMLKKMNQQAANT